MSGYRLHILFYCAFISILLPILHQFFEPGIPKNTLFIGVSIGILYSILPDVDARRSKIRKLLTGILVLSLVLYLVSSEFIPGLMTAVLALLLFLTLFAGHRGVFHTITAAILFSTPLLLLDPWVFLFAFLGVLTHLALDGKLFTLF
jgi:hypothetical protein